MKKDKKNIIIIMLVIVIMFGLIYIIKENKDRNIVYYDSSYLLVSDGDFSKEYYFTYDSNYINVELINNEIKITPIKKGNTVLMVDYITNTSEKKTLSYNIDVRNGLFLEIGDKY